MWRGGEQDQSFVFLSEGNDENGPYSLLMQMAQLVRAGQGLAQGRDQPVTSGGSRESQPLWAGGHSA